MTVLASLGSQSYAPQTRNVAFSMNPALTQFVLSLTHPDWPTGECVRIDVDWGSEITGQCRIGGGVIRDKAGNPTGGTAVTSWTCNKPAGIGNGTLDLQVMQTLTTAVLLEGF